MRFVELNSDTVRGIDIDFTDPPTFNIGYCGPRSEFTMPSECEENYRTWTFIKEDNTLNMLCNGARIYRFYYATSTVDECTDMWSSDSDRIIFPRDDVATDTASDYYRSLAHSELSV